LLRVVAGGDVKVEYSGQPSSRENAGTAVTVVPDARRRLPGRGAYIHPDPACLALAERRRAFGRALRMTGVVDTGRLSEYVATGGVLQRSENQVVGNHPGQQGRTTDMSTR
jgi:hypothetical protein